MPIIDELNGVDLQIKNIFSGFSVSDDDTHEFLLNMSSEWLNQVEKDEKLKEENDIENSLSILSAMEDALKDIKRSDPKIEHVNSTSLADFVKTYCKENTKQFWRFVYPFEDKIDDGGSHVLNMKRAHKHKKSQNAAKAYAHRPSGRSYDLDKYNPAWVTSPDDIIVLFDTSVFGSGKTGIVFTDNYVVFKGIQVLPHDLYYYKDIKSIKVNEDKELEIRGKSITGESGEYFKYNDYKIDHSLSLVTDAVTEYINQPAFKLSNYLKNKRDNSKELSFLGGFFKRFGG